MTENKYLGNEALPEVIYAINNRLKTVITMPATADDGQVLLYVGTASVNYETGHVYKYSSTDGWVDITSSVSVQVSTVAELEAITAGTIVQYVGATNSKYTKGYFYTKSNLSATLNLTAGTGYYMTTIDASDLESTLPYSLYGGWTLNSVSDVDTAVSIISDTGMEATCDNADITVSVGTGGAGTISLSYGATGDAPSDPFTVTMSVTAIVAVPTMAIEVAAPDASEVSYDDTSGELDADNVQDAIDTLNDKVDNLPTVTVDQTYSASSTNAQSGTAVAEALATVSAKTFELLTPANSTYSLNGYLENTEDSEGSLSGTISDWSDAKGVMITVDNSYSECADSEDPYTMMSITYDTTAPSTSAANNTNKKQTFIAMKSPTSEMLKVAIVAGLYGDRLVSTYFTMSIDTEGEYTISCPFAPKEDSDSESDTGWHVIKIRSIYVIY